MRADDRGWVRRGGRAGVLGPVLALVAAGMWVVGGAAPVAGAADASCWSDVGSDLDGAGPDVVVGMPSYDLPGKPDAGAVVVFSDVADPGEPTPRAPVRRTVVTADDIPGLASAAGARFGTSPVVWADGPDDPDRCADLLVGAPGQQVGTRVGAGRAYLLHGSATGLDRVLQSWDEDSLPGLGGAQAGAGFGSALAAEPLSLVAVGVPGRDVGGARDAGRVVRLDYASSPSSPDVDVVEQGRSGAGAAEAGDRFGEVLGTFSTGVGPVLVVGVPREDVGSAVDSGAVASMPRDGPLTLVSQDSTGAAGRAEAGDRYGAAVDTYCTFLVDHPSCVVAIGVPGEDLSGAGNAGMVSFAAVDLFLPGQPVAPIRGLPSSLSQQASAVPGAAEAGDAFGSSLATGEFGTDAGQTHLLVGSPGEDLGRTVDAGMVTMTRLDPQTARPLAGSQPGAWSQDSTGVSGAAERGDRFGATVSAVQLSVISDDDDITWAVALATVPGEDLGSTQDAGLAHLGVPPGPGTITLQAPVVQSGAGAAMSGMRMLVG